MELTVGQRWPWPIKNGGEQKVYENVTYDSLGKS